jgi:hypothetical protein
MNHAQKGQRRKDGKKERGRRNEALIDSETIRKGLIRQPPNSLIPRRGRA